MSTHGNASEREHETGQKRYLKENCMSLGSAADKIIHHSTE
jgi:hypothetical protein